MSDPQTPPALDCRGVTFAYPDGTAALADVNVSVARGQVLAVVGANGSGKTTLMKVFMRLLKPQAGGVALNGEDIAALSAECLYARVGMVFQNPADQLFAATVEQDVAFGPRNLHLAEAEVAERVNAALAAVNVAALRDRPIHHLSYGEQKRVCLAGVLAMQPEVLVLDEPTSGLDPQAEAAMLRLLLDLNRQRGLTMILSTHAMDLLPAVADRVCVLDRGRVLRQGLPREILADESLASAGLRLPLIGQLFRELATRDQLVASPLPLTIEQARAQVLAWVNSCYPSPSGRGSKGEGLPQSPQLDQSSSSPACGLAPFGSASDEGLTP